jgi:hypothetical protein
MMNPILLTVKVGISSALKPALAAAIRLQQLAFIALVSLVQYPGKKGSAYDILWALLFGFATLNILGLVARRFEPARTRMSFGEVLAILIVIVSVFLLLWEFLNLLHIFPIHLKPR